jgi:uncharacterized protein (DUF736 family)
METKNNSGAIFKNDKKQKETHPDYKGKINVEGKDFEVALWLKESAKGMKYFSVAISEPYVPEQQVQPERAPSGDSVDDDLPF